MKKLFRIFALPILLFQVTHVVAGIIYTNPETNSKLVNIRSNIIIGVNSKLDPLAVKDRSVIKVTGSQSGKHEVLIRITKDRMKMIFEPETPFELGEVVNVNVNIDKYLPLKNRTGNFEFSFTTQKTLSQKVHNTLYGDKYLTGIEPDQDQYSYHPGTIPEITVSNSLPSDGKIFLSNFPFTNIANTPYLLILNNNGSVHTAVRLKQNGADFKKTKKGTLTFFSDNEAKFFEMDNNYNIIDSFYCGNGYSTDIHELQLLDNSHALLMSYDEQIIDMSSIVAGGNPSATVIGLIIQEIDENKNVVFQWRSWDHIPITDASHQDLTASRIDYIHGNAIELDNDGNILISSRHLDEITKISRTTGEIIWRLGGSRNQFQFINDPDKFNYQHGIRRLPNGNIILFDNGNFHTPPYSRAVEYALDEANKTATMVWQYKNTPVIFGFAMGFAQRLENGNTFISWGSTNPSATEVTPEGNIVQEIFLPPGIYSYRSFKYEWNGPSAFIDTLRNNIPLKFSLEQNFPNPFNPSTTINFDIPEYSRVNLSIFDCLGRKINTLIERELNFGPYSIEFTPNSLPSGIYFYRLTVNEQSETKKMILLK
ncbi:MAG: aryl-sulfate sulfotransferase [Ignavibacteria bacterium]|nr:aryl-sulfate sulfotransferase [Ignavibacteria bacterium]